MSSFNHFSPQKSSSIRLNSLISLNPFSSPHSTLNPDASTYIPLNAFTNKHSESQSLNAAAAPYIPLPPKLNVPKKRTKKNNSFTYYSNLNSSQIYNVTYKYIEMNATTTNCEESKLETCDILSTISSSIMATPIPASVTSSVFSDNNIDLMNIEPYIPNKNMTDIDGINNIIHKPDTDHTNINNINNHFYDDNCNDIHPVIAALTEQESNQLLNAPIWTPDQHNKEDKITEPITYSKIAIDEQDYQFIIHPNKKPIKYGYKQVVIGGKIAKDNLPHLQYMNHMAMAKDDYKPTSTNIAGETYIENTTTTSNRISESEIKTTDINDINNINQSSNSNVTNYKFADNDITYTNTNNLYSNKPSRIAMEGYCNLFDNKTSHTHTASNIYNIAYDTYTLKYTQLYNQSRIAQPNIEKISYIYCKT